MHDVILAMESHYSGYCDVGISIFQLRTADIYELFRGTMQSGMILKQKDKNDACLISKDSLSPTPRFSGANFGIHLGILQRLNVFI